MKILTDKKYKALMDEVAYKTERRCYEAEERRRLYDKIESLERRVSELECKLHLPETEGPVCVEEKQ